VPSIVQVGFLLLEVSDGDPGEDDGSDKGVMSTEDIGVSMLKSLFETHEMAQTEVRSNIVWSFVLRSQLSTHSCLLIQ
jgi:fanconi anemia group I protein